MPFSSFATEGSSSQIPGRDQANHSDRAALAHCSSNSQSSTVKAFARSLSTSIVPDNSCAAIQDRNNDFRECTVEGDKIPAVTPNVADDYRALFVDHRSGEPLADCESRVSRRIRSTPRNDGNPLKADIVKANPAILPVLPDDPGQLASLFKTILRAHHQSPDVVQNLCHSGRDNL
jgi:hypothetical protein